MGLLANEKVAVTPDIKDAIWTALQNLASAPAAERTLTGLAVLVQSNKLSQALHPYTLEGPYGHLLDGAADTLAFGDVMHFEMDGLMQVKPLVLPVLTYLFHRLEARFDGRPTLLVLDEAWLFLDDPLFAARIREWLKTLRKKNVAVVFATQSLADIERSSIAPALLESCPTRIFLPNDRAIEPQAAVVYERFGLNQRQIEIIARATPKRDYYAQTARGNRQFELGLGPIALAFAGAGSPDDQRSVDRCLGASKPAGFAIAFLRAKGLGWAAELLEGLITPTETPKPPPPLREGVPAARTIIKPAAALLDSTAVGAVLAAEPANVVSQRLSPFRIPPAKPKRTKS
jgi:type IV secretion system protein VirB4